MVPVKFPLRVIGLRDWIELVRLLWYPNTDSIVSAVRFVLSPGLWLVLSVRTETPIWCDAFFLGYGNKREEAEYGATG